MVIKHNLIAMNANRQLGVTTKSAASSTEKLSSGYQINRAADNAAGLAISEKMRKQIRGLDRASENSEDGISCVQTAEGALAEVEDMLQRMNELCVQAANGTNSVTDRQYIQDELDQLVKEVDRVAETTKFNDTYLLKGDDNARTTNSYVTSYSVTYTRNNISNASAPNALPYKVNYTGKNNVYMVSNEIFTINANTPYSAQKIANGDDITDYMVTSTMSENKANASLNTTSYVAFVNVELNSDVKTGVGGVVYSNLTSPTSIQKYNADLSTDGITDVVRASRDLYIYDTDRKTVTRVTAGEEMSEYLEDDNTMNSNYRLVDVLDGGGADAQITYRGTQSSIYAVPTVATDAVDEKAATYNMDITALSHDNAYRDLLVKSNKTMADYVTATVTGTAPTTTTTYSQSVPGGSLFLIGSSIYQYNSINTTTGECSFTRAYGNTGNATETLGLGALTGATILQSPETYTEGSSYRIRTTLYGGEDYYWSDKDIEIDTSEQKLYNADGREVTSMGLYQYFDKDGKYTGGLFTTDQARVTDEVVSSNQVNGLATIGMFIQQYSTKVAGALSFDLQSGSDSNLSNKVTVDINTLTSAGIGINQLASQNIGIVDDTGLKATDAIDVVADAITMISRQRALLGAVQNRLEHTIKNLDNVVENTQAAESTIRDTDMAEEMVQYSNQNILQQAGQSMLAQANQANQGIMNLIQ